MSLEAVDCRAVPALTADHVFRSFGPTEVLRDVSLAVELREKVGLVGINGSGKSTLGKILAGVDLPDAGVIARRRDLEFMYLSQEPVLDGDATVYAEVEGALGRWKTAVAEYERLSKSLEDPRGDTEGLLVSQASLAEEIERLGGWDPRHRIHTMLDHLGVQRSEQRVSELSGGERRRVALAKILLAAPGMAVLDEPTNHLDADTAEWLEKYLREEFEGALVLITHDRYFLDTVVTRIAELDRGEIFLYDGNYGDYLQAKAERLEHEARTEARRTNILRREREWLARGPKARSTKQKARIQRAGELEEVTQRARRSDETATLQAASVRVGKTILELHGVSKSYGERELFRGLNLILSPGERLGVIGQNGSGKTTLVKLVLGEESPSQGEVILGQNTKVAYFDQGRSGLEDHKSIYDNLFEGSDKVRLGERWMDLRAYLELFLFEVPKQRQLVGALSGGERARVALARMLRGDANLLILDEPTNDLDLATLGALEELLSEWPGCAIVVTHDRYFLNRVATSILAFERGGLVHQPGDYDTYRALRDAREKAAQEVLREKSQREDPRSMAQRVTQKSKVYSQRGLTLGEVLELRGLPGLIDGAESELRELESKLNDPGLYAKSAEDAQALRSEVEAARGSVEELMARWESLESRKEV